MWVVEGDHDGACVGDDGRLPLVALLGRAHDAFEAEFDRRLLDSEFCALSLARSRNVLRHLDGSPLRASQLVARCGVSKQALSEQIAHLEREGYLTTEPDPDDQRARLLALTDRGERAQRLVLALFGEIERDWAEAVARADGAGATAAEVEASLRRLLGALVELDVGAPLPGRC